MIYTRKSLMEKVERSVIILILLSLTIVGNAAIVKKMKGKVSIIRSGKEFIARPNSVVNNGDIIKTKKSSFLQLKFENDAVLTVGPNSMVKVEKIDANKTKLLTLLKGQLRSVLPGQKTEDHKLVIKTKTASLGVRGTDFHIIYNDQNNVSTAISYEGDVEFSSSDSASKEVFREDKVVIKEGQFSGIYTEDGYVNEPVRFAPKQYRALKNNSLLASGSSSKKRVNKKKKRLNKLVKIDGLQKNQLAVNRGSSDAIPGDLLGDVHRGANRDEIELFRPKAGGYIDLNTGIYISPVEGSRYDPKEDLYYPPEEYGSINEVTGEYIPPVGLILHPLNGFVIASSTVEKGVKKVRHGVTTVGKYIFKGITTAGGLVMDGASKVGGVVVDNTGESGKVVSKGATKVKNMVVDGISKVSNFAANSTTQTFEYLANNLNSHLYQGLLKPIASVIKKSPIISSLQIRLFDDFGYSSAQRFYLYDQVDSVVNIPSFHNKLKLISAYKKFLVKGIFVRPKINIEKINYVRDEIPEIHELNYYAFKYGLDLGLLKKFSNVTLQTFFFAYKASVKKYSNQTYEYETYLKDNIFGFSKALIGKKYLTSRFDYTYTDFAAHAYNFDGKQHKLHLSEIIMLNDQNFIDLSTFWSRRDGTQVSHIISNYGLKLNYYWYTSYRTMKVNAWTKVTFSKSQHEFDTRGKEKITEAGINLSKTFEKYFSTQFQYFVNDIRSKSYLFDNRSHNFLTKVAVTF